MMNCDISPYIGRSAELPSGQYARLIGTAVESQIGIMARIASQYHHTCPVENPTLNNDMICGIVRTTVRAYVEMSQFIVQFESG